MRRRRSRSTPDRSRPPCGGEGIHPQRRSGAAILKRAAPAVRSWAWRPVVSVAVRVLGFGTYDARAHPRVATLLAGVRDRGGEVTELVVPLGFDTADRVRMLRRPWRVPVLALRLATRWMVLTRRARRLADRHPDVVVVGYLGHFDVLLARRLFPRSRIVLDHLIGAADTARDRGVTSGPALRVLSALDAAALAAADVVVVDTDEQRAVLPPRYRDRAVVVAVGAPPLWRPDPHRPPVGDDRPLRVVFFGTFTPLQGTEVLAAALGQLVDTPQIEATLVGDGQDRPAARVAAAGNPAVRWLNWVPPERLPELVAAADICLGIFGTGPKALRVVPNKVFQGAAAGCAIVTSDTAPQRRVLDAAAVFVPPGDPTALATALRQLAGDRQRVAGLQRAAAELAAASFTPRVVVGPLCDRLTATGSLAGGAAR